jgi:hypothetical protein
METAIPIENRANLPAAQFDTLYRSLLEHHSIKHALDWLQGHNPPLTVSDMVTQDEFSHDILIDYSAGLCLVYDVT